MKDIINVVLVADIYCNKKWNFVWITQLLEVTGNNSSDVKAMVVCFVTNITL